MLPLCSGLAVNMQTGAQETASQWEKLIPDLARLERFVLWTTTSQIAALENLRPELELLETRLAATNGIQASILEHLIADLVRLTKANFSRRDAVQFSVDSFVADDDLQKLSALARQQQLEFDAFAFMGRLLPEPSADLWRSEIFHSKLLAWLLDPTENHRSGENFLKTFLLQAKAPPAFQSLDWSRSVVFREWTNEVDGKSGYLDILICNEWELALCAIENKVFSGEHSQQLTRYRMALETEFPEFAKHLIFLTPNQLLPAREQEQEHWIPVGYLQVVDAIQRLVDDEER